jgi:hypothetical protein
MATPIRTNTLSGSEESHPTSAPPVVRQLKPPPEIWELVHPVTAERFKPGRSFASRLASRWTALVLFAFAVGLAGGGGVALWKHPAIWSSFHSARPAQMQPEKPKAENVETAKAAPVSSAAEAVVQPTETTPSAQSQTVNANLPARRVVPRRADSSRLNTESATGTRVSSSASASNQRPIGPTPGKAADGNAQGSTDSSTTKAKSSSALSPQLIAPVKPAPANKAKVIQWP